MGQRVAEIRQHAVAHELGKEAIKPGYRTGADVLISPDQRAHILGVDGVGQFCRADQVAKHDGDLTSLRVARRGGAGRGFCRRRRLPRVKREFPRLDRTHELSPVPERKAELLEIALPELEKDVEVDIVFGEDRRIFFEAKLLEPIVHLGHGIGSPPRRTAHDVAVRRGP